MKWFLTFIVFISVVFSSKAQGIEFFHGTLEEAKAKALKENKLIFIDCYTTWCGPCKMLAKFVFVDPELGNFHNENFINLKLDMEKEGVSVGYEYSISGYPTLLYIDHTGLLKKKLVGGRDAKALIEEGKEAMKPDANTMRKMENKYIEGVRDTDFLYNYIKLLAQPGKSFEVELREYLSLLDEKGLISPKTTKLIYEIANHVNSASTKQILNHLTLYKERYSVLKIDQAIIKIAKKTSLDAAKNKDKDAFDKGQALLMNAKVKDAKKIQLLHEIIWYEALFEWNNFANVTSKYISKYAAKDTVYIKAFLDKVERNTLEEKTLTILLKEAKRLVQLQPSYEHLLIIAKIYHKLHMNEKALEYTKMAINSMDAEDNSEARTLEDIIKKGLPRSVQIK